MAIGRRHRAPKWLQKVINGPVVAISRFGGSKLVDQRGSRLDLVRAHPGRCVATYSPVRNGHRGAPYGLEMAPKGHNGPFVAISRSGGSELVDQGWIKVGSSPGTSGLMCWDLFPGPKWPSGGAIGP